MKTRTVKGKEQGYCASGDHWLPLTDENFYFRGTGKDRHVYLNRCKPHERTRSAEWHKAARVAKASAKPAPKKATVKKSAARNPRKKVAASR